MPGKRTAGRFRENEIARGVKAVLKGGATIKRVTITPQGSVSIECGQDAESHGSTENEWDRDLYGKDTPPVR